MAPPQKSSFKINDESSPEGKWNGKYDDFKTLGENLDIKTFSDSAAPFGEAQGLLLTTYEELSTQAYQLADLWQGKAAAEFQNNLKALYQSACALADATGQVNVAIGYHATDLQTLKDNVAKMKPDEGKSFNDVMFGSSWDPLGMSHRTTSAEEHDNQANQQVQDWINNKLTYSTTAYTFTELPKDVHLELPDPTPQTYNPTATRNGPNGPSGHLGSGGGGGGIPHMTSPTSHMTPPNSHFTPPNSHLTTPGSHLNTPDSPLGNDAGTDLAGLNTHTPGGLGNPSLSDGLGGPGGGGLGGLGSPGGGLGGGGLGGGGLGGGGLGGGGLGGLGSRGTGSSAGLGGAAAEEEAAAARAAAAGKGGTNGGMPMGMGGGAGGGQEQERERTTWLNEDEDVWGGDDDVAPPVIG